MKEFSERFENGPDGKLTFITNGAGDVIDFDPKLSRNAFDGARKLPHPKRKFLAAPLIS